jgi:uncharacterized protein YjbJ (UPF0337 family)
MTPEAVADRWKLLRDDVKMRWGRLTDDEIEEVAGSIEKLSGLLQQRYGYARDQADREVDAWWRAVGR